MASAAITTAQTPQEAQKQDNANKYAQEQQTPLNEAQTQPEAATQTDAGGHLTAYAGVYYYGDQKETYYNLPMDGVIANAHARGIEGDYWVREDGCKMLGDYIMIAANQSVHPYGSIVQTSLGAGIVVDTGGFAAYNPLQVDIAVTW